MEKTKKKLSLGWQILIGFVVGIILGLIFNENILKIKFIGDIFMNLLKMLVMPLVMLSIIDGISGIRNAKTLRNLSFKTFGFFLANTILACVAGILLMKLFNPGAGVVIDATVADAYEATAVPSFADTVKSFFPSNVFESLANGNMIQVIVFALFFGVALATLGDKASSVKKAIHQGSEVMYKVTKYVLALSPIGVCVLIACSVGQYGIGIFGAMGKFIVADYAAQILFFVIIYLPLVKFGAKIKVGYFFKKILRVWAMAASTTSSAGTLPVTMDVAHKDLGIDEDVCSFVLPLGCTVNMAGGALYNAAVIVFAAQIYGISLTFPQLFLLVATATLLCIGSPGIPGGGVVSAVMLMTLLGLPLEVAGMIAGIYRLLDMAHTVMNVSGDIVTAAVVARSENMIDVPRKE